MAKPRLRFKEFTDDWEQRKLDELITIGSGKDYKHLSSGNVPVYGTGGYMLSVNDALSRTSDAIGIGRKGTIDRPFILRAPFWTVDTLFFVLPEVEEVDLNFLYCLFQRIDWSKKDESTGVPSLTKQSIGRTKCFTPSLTEQRSIGRLFFCIDNLITLQQRKLDGLKELKKGCLQKLFPKNSSLFPEVRFPGFTEPWEQREVSSIAEKNSGGGTPSTNNEQYWNGSIPWIQSSDLIEDNLLEVVPKKFINETALKESASKLIDKDSIAIVTRVGVGKLALLRFPYASSQDFLSLSKLKINTLFAVYSLKNLVQRLQNSTQGTSIKGIRKEELLNAKIFVPSMNEQELIGTFLMELDNLITLQQRKIETMKNLKKYLLQNMFV